MYEINKNIVYVKGASRGAIYNFNSGDVFSVNTVACQIIDKLRDGADDFSTKETDYIKLLVTNGLYDENFTIKKYKPDLRDFKNLKLAWLEITQACNMKCLHCYEGSSHVQSKNKLNLTQWKHIIDQLKMLDVERVVVIGGEPTINPDVIEILKYLSFKNVPTTLFTNAFFKDEKLRETIVEHKIRLKISLYGHNATVHDTITTIPGSFDRLIENIKYFIQKSVDISLAVTLMKENENYVNEIEDFIKSLGIKQYKFDVIRQVYCGTQHEHIPTLQETRNFSLRRKPNFTTSKTHFDTYFNKNTCWYGKLVVTEEGKILPCVFERNIILGDINHQTLDDIINSSQTKKYWYLDYSKVNVCMDCEYRFACTDCRPLAFSKAGNIFEKNLRCTYNPYKGEWGNE